jgi:hypothetical protein
MNSYEAKQEARKQRLEARAERTRAESDAAFNRGSDMFSIIPFGQPILIGHHSEGRDRNYRAKAARQLDKGVALSKEAAKLEARAEAVGTGGISSDDPEAVQKLSQEIDGLKAAQARMVAANKAIRRNSAEELTSLGFTPTEIAGLFKPDFCGRIGFPSHALSNNSANIRRIEQRIEHLKRNAARETVETARADGVRIVENADINRLQIFFPGKPAEEMRKQLKSCGFRWSPSEGAWQRHLGANAKWAAERILGTENPS